MPPAQSVGHMCRAVNLAAEHGPRNKLAPWLPFSIPSMWLGTAWASSWRECVAARCPPCCGTCRHTTSACTLTSTADSRKSPRPTSSSSCACRQGTHVITRALQAGSIGQQENGKPNFNLLCSRASYPRSLKVQLGACSSHLCQQLPDALPQCREGCFLP